eukprot:13434683-Alexandrium_andersonii.AAC.1
MGRTSSRKACPAVTERAEMRGARMPPTACSFSASRRSRAEGSPGPRRAVGCATRTAGAAGCHGRLDAGSHCPPAVMAAARALPNSAGYAAAAL